jgi:FKBP-type peptidyl-prolyl cis-trans isomerase
MGATDIMSMDEFQQYVDKENMKMQEQALVKEEAQFEIDKQLIDEFLGKENIEAETHESGLRYTIVKQGTGPLPQPGQTIRVNYTGRILDGAIFDTSDAELAKAEGIYDQRREPYEPIAFQLGTRGVIEGWDIGFGLLNKGTKAVLYIPSKLGYGPQARSATIPANSIMVFDVELIDFSD